MAAPATGGENGSEGRDGEEEEEEEERKKLALITSCIFKQAHAAGGEESSILGESHEKDRDVERFAADVAREGLRRGGGVVAGPHRSSLIDEDAASHVLLTLFSC